MKCHLAVLSVQALEKELQPGPGSPVWPCCLVVNTELLVIVSPIVSFAQGSADAIPMAVQQRGHQAIPVSYAKQVALLQQWHTR